MKNILSVFVLTLLFTGSVNPWCDAYAAYYDINGIEAPQRYVEQEYKAGGEIRSTPAIDNNDNIYFGSDDNYLYSIKPDFSENWKYDVGGKVESSPAIDIVNDETVIYIGSNDTNLYAINANCGTAKWTFETTGEIKTSPAIDNYGNIYVGTFDGNLYKIDAAGNQIWKSNTDWSIYSSPVIDENGTIYVTTTDGNLRAIDSDGNPLWEYKAERMLRISPAIGSDGTIYVGSEDTYLHAINPDGTNKWTFKTDGPIWTSPVIDKNGTIIIGSNDGKFYAINPDDGSKKWERETGSPIYSSPVIGNNDIVYVASNNTILALDTEKGDVKWTTWVNNGLYTNLTMSRYGELYFCGSGSLYVVKTDSTGLEYSAWPKFGSNLKNRATIVPMMIQGTAAISAVKKSQNGSIYLKAEFDVNGACEMQFLVNGKEPTDWINYETPIILSFDDHKFTLGHHQITVKFRTKSTDTEKTITINLYFVDNNTTKGITNIILAQEGHNKWSFIKDDYPQFLKPKVEITIIGSGGDGCGGRRGDQIKSGGGGGGGAAGNVIKHTFEGLDNELFIGNIKYNYSGGKETNCTVLGKSFTANNGAPATGDSSERGMASHTGAKGQYPGKDGERGEEGYFSPWWKWNKAQPGGGGEGGNNGTGYGHGGWGTSGGVPWPAFNPENLALGDSNRGKLGAILIKIFDDKKIQEINIDDIPSVDSPIPLRIISLLNCTDINF